MLAFVTKAALAVSLSSLMLSPVMAEAAPRIASHADLGIGTTAAKAPA